MRVTPVALQIHRKSALEQDFALCVSLSINEGAPLTVVCSGSLLPRSAPSRDRFTGATMSCEGGRDSSASISCESASKMDPGTASCKQFTQTPHMQANSAATEAAGNMPQHCWDSLPVATFAPSVVRLRKGTQAADLRSVQQLLRCVLMRNLGFVTGAVAVGTLHRWEQRGQVELGRVLVAIFRRRPPAPRIPVAALRCHHQSRS